VAPLPTPIIGRETVSDPRQPLAALAEFYRAFSTGDLALMELNWDVAGEPVMDNPLGGIMRGWPAIRERCADRSRTSRARRASGMRWRS